MTSHGHTCYKTPLGRIESRGCAGNGTHHWLGQRLSAGALLLLSLWFLIAVFNHELTAYDRVIPWCQDPITFVLLTLYLGAITYHGLLGVESVLIDYIQTPTTRRCVLWTTRTFLTVGAFYGWVQLLSIYIRGLR